MWEVERRCYRGSNLIYYLLLTELLKNPRLLQYSVFDDAFPRERRLSQTDTKIFIGRRRSRNMQW